MLGRLMAFIAYMQSAPSQDEVAAYFVTESEFVTELVNLIEADLLVPETLRTLALRALAVQVAPAGQQQGRLMAGCNWTHVSPCFPSNLHQKHFGSSETPGGSASDLPKGVLVEPSNRGSC